MPEVVGCGMLGPEDLTCWHPRAVEVLFVSTPIYQMFAAVVAYHSMVPPLRIVPSWTPHLETLQ